MVGRNRSSYKQIHRLPSILPAARIKEQKPGRNRRVIFVLIATGIVILAYWFIFRSPYFAVTKIEVTGVDPATVKSVVDRMIGTNIFGLNSVGVETDMKQVYPPVASVSLVRGLPHTLRLSVTLRQPALRWQVNDSTTFILDSNGEAFELGDKETYASLPKISDKSGIQVQLGQRVTTAAFIDFMNQLHTAIPNELHRAQIGSEITETSFHVDVMLEGEIRVKMTTQRPSLEQVKAAATILQAHPEAKTVDVRVPKWGYWKT